MGKKNNDLFQFKTMWMFWQCRQMRVNDTSAFIMLDDEVSFFSLGLCKKNNMESEVTAVLI